jgi:phospholipase C
LAFSRVALGAAALCLIGKAFLPQAAIAAGTPASPIDGRCGYSPRQPLLVISPFAKANFVDRTVTDQSSVLRFIEDNWGTGRISGGSFDQIAGSLANMFDFDGGHAFGERRLILDPSTGQPLH